MITTKAFNSLHPAKKRNLLTLFGAGLLFWFSITSLLPVLPLYIQHVGGTKQEIGLVMGCFAIGLLCSRSLLGQTADRQGRRIVILIGTVVVGIAPLGYLLAKSIPELMFLRAFHGISIAAFTTGYSALVVDIAPAKQRGELIGYMSLAIPIGMAVGPALGGYTQEYFGYSTLFLISSLAGFIAWLCALQIQEKKIDIKSDRENEKSLPRRNFWELMINPALSTPAIILLMIGLLFGSLVTFLPLYIEESNVDFNAGLFYAFAACASFIARVFVGKASDRVGRGLFITGSLVFYSVSMILLALASTPFALTIAALLEGAGGGVFIPISIALISDRSYANERGKVYSICIGGFDLGVAVAGPIFGFLSSQLSYSVIFLLTGGLALLGLVIFLIKSNRSLSGSLQFAFGKGKDYYALSK
ncbi:MAG: MFS transporter [Xenococcaceae cyanobacterium MO_188.B29]|nr:MFS transporter [Xenococcaceae cyanobacterium MO_188.B29]